MKRKGRTRCPELRWRNSFPVDAKVVANCDVSNNLPLGTTPSGLETTPPLPCHARPFVRSLSMIGCSYYLPPLRMLRQAVSLRK